MESLCKWIYIAIALLSVVNSQNFYCKHSEFRCSNENKCLTIEQICNGKKECRNGEDEAGSSQWNCQKRTLSTDCNQQTQFKCRFGGCIPKNQLCNNNLDCWGGNDESVELCGDSSSNKNDNRQQQAPPRTTTPRPRPKPRPPQTTTTTYRPPQTERTRPPYIPPPQPPQTTRAPQTSSNNQCPPIYLAPEEDGYKITCITKTYDTIDCLSKSVPFGTTARYECKRFFLPPKVGGSTTERTCTEGGRWSKLRSNYQCFLDCGEPGAEFAQFIVGGYNAKKGQWPWAAALFHEDPPKSKKYVFFCGATLISRRVAITAAHCVTNGGTETKRNPREVIIMLGKYFRSIRNTDKMVQPRRIIEIDVHEEYNHYNLENDIALLWLDKPAQISTRVRPVCLPDSDEDTQPDDENLGIVVGFGRAANDQFKEELQETRLPIVSHTTCRNSHPSFLTLARGSTFCAGYRNGTAACDGDSGSAFVLPDANQRNKYRIQGIVSAGVRKATGGCKETYYTAFTKVSRYRQWLDALLEKEYLKR